MAVAPCHHHGNRPVRNSGQPSQANLGRPAKLSQHPDATEGVAELNPIGPARDDHAVELTRCFLRLANLPNFALDRLSRYEATLWRQSRQILLALNALDRRKPQERTRFCIDDVHL
jgi:hypothetical protein